MKAPTKKRQQELLAMAQERIESADHFDYHNWDDAIECDESITTKELDWLRDQCEVAVSVTPKDQIRAARWYCLSRTGIATLCIDEPDAQKVARQADVEWPREAPHIATQLATV